MAKIVLYGGLGGTWSHSATRKFTVANYFASEPFLADSHRQSSPSQPKEQDFVRDNGGFSHALAQNVVHFGFLAFGTASRT